MKPATKIRKSVRAAIEVAEGGQVQKVQRVLEALIAETAQWDWIVLALCNIAVWQSEKTADPLWMKRARELHKSVE